ncbi:BlaI/MecI/CopY family transcriptional regulator [Pedomonas mirosovicensis]|uniref:BlaI/MecI/CopY family transcriptional regulator n=1 Tax=Pedomonas mirosovicensis TaxID=2908641 RepID=UPI00216791E4|nr:BlaI/MecI/CopY family transcriptional regulator [Pedomonas mirosovicensis]MCH8685899.1 BlaI/MecI/CopY family transcriptional regulator [Pedomonas mirosovicensis]
MPTIPDLSKAEYDVLRVLWRLRQASVREVHDQLEADTGWAYTTTKTVMDRMAAKSLLARDNLHGAFVYRPLVSRAAGLARFVRFFADRVVERDLGVVLGLFRNSEALNDDELAELERLVREEDESEKADAEAENANAAAGEKR